MTQIMSPPVPGRPWTSRAFVVKSLGPQLIPFTQATCIYFVLFLPHDSLSAVACFIKCLPILSLCGFVLLHGNVRSSPTNSQSDKFYSRSILLGLIFSTLGDAFLQYSAVGFFLPGMAAFGLAHVCYITAFGMDPLHPASGVVIFAAGAGIFFWLLPYLQGVFRIAVGIYFILVSLMGWRAVARVPLRNDQWTWTTLGCAIGAGLFCLSDLMIAVKMFYADFPHSQVLIMSTYYLAQMNIAVSVVEGQIRPPVSALQQVK